MHGLAAIVRPGPVSRNTYPQRTAAVCASQYRNIVVAADDLKRIVRRAIVDDDALNAFVLLPQYRFGRLRHEVGIVIVVDDHGN